MEENKISKQIVPLDVDYSSKKERIFHLSQIKDTNRRNFYLEIYLHFYANIYNYLLMNLPNDDTLEKNEILEAYLPWNKNIQETCR